MTQHSPLVIDVAGATLSADDHRRLAHPLVGGVILFSRNWQHRMQLLELTAAIKAVRDDLLICVDHEGGRVQRFRTDGFTHLPPMRAFGELWTQDGKGSKHREGSGALRAMDAATAAGYVLASELRACGVDFSFTPVLDLDWKHEAPTPAQALAAPRGGSESLGRPGASRSTVIGDRAFHSDPRVVAMLSRALMHGLLQAGMANCGKHFPGHGHVAADSHTEVPVDRRSLTAILKDDAAPYAWLSSVLTSVMPAHVIYPKVDSRPAGFSSKWLQDILRTRLRFDGAIFSDDLSMEGARRLDGQLVGYADAAVAALQAGCDLVLLCNQSLEGGRAVDELIDGLAAAGAAGRWQPSEASEARRVALLPETLPQPWEELMVQPAYMHALDLLP
ncbi:beta-N-acetylhexosaminidase [Pulveribacter suum]|uniref:Beta-hexosaminidase n=1 Tax=Pulveribacter suum TaxID=2116657 RepID=A0A2P1NJQ0_9BURK|nr:beta-N-acetylhexosaminidase [Pulveribacter suum]AVP57252.1 beta-N-acetylhexosaminidase [Pulveribacter suum]